MTGKRKLAALLSLLCMAAMALYACGQPESMLEESPDLVASPAPEDSAAAPETTGPVRRDADDSTPTESPSAGSGAEESAEVDAVSDDPLTGAFLTVNNFLDSNGAGDAVKDILSAEEIQTALVAYHTDADVELATLPEEARVMDVLAAAPLGEKGVLALAQFSNPGVDELQLHWIQEGKVSQVSGGSLWWINYSWVDGRYVFYGQGGQEPVSGDSAFVSQNRGGELATFPLRDGKWFVAVLEPGADFPADLYVQRGDGQRVSDQQAGMFYSLEQEILRNKLLYYPLLPAGMRVDLLPMQEGEDIAVECPMLPFSWRMEEESAAPVPPAVVWRDANLMSSAFSGQRNLRFVTMDGVTAAYIAKVDGDDGTGDGADRLQAIDLAQVRENDGKLPRPKQPGEYAYIVDKDLDGGVARYGLPFRVEQAGD